VRSSLMKEARAGGVMVAVGKEYGVSDNTIGDWISSYTNDIIDRDK
jgi:transposase-like protein